MPTFMTDLALLSSNLHDVRVDHDGRLTPAPPEPVKLRGMLAVGEDIHTMRVLSSVGESRRQCASQIQQYLDEAIAGNGRALHNPKHQRMYKSLHGKLVKLSTSSKLLKSGDIKKIAKEVHSFISVARLQKGDQILHNRIRFNQQIGRLEISKDSLATRALKAILLKFPSGRQLYARQATKSFTQALIKQYGAMPGSTQTMIQDIYKQATGQDIALQGAGKAQDGQNFRPLSIQEALTIYARIEDMVNRGAKLHNLAKKACSQWHATPPWSTLEDADKLPPWQSLFRDRFIIKVEEYLVEKMASMPSDTLTKMDRAELKAEINSIGQKLFDGLSEITAEQTDILRKLEYLQKIVLSNVEVAVVDKSGDKMFRALDYCLDQLREVIKSDPTFDEGGYQVESVLSMIFSDIGGNARRAQEMDVSLSGPFGKAVFFTLGVLDRDCEIRDDINDGQDLGLEQEYRKKKNNFGNMDKITRIAVTVLAQKIGRSPDSIARQSKAFDQAYTQGQQARSLLNQELIMSQPLEAEGKIIDQSTAIEPNCKSYVGPMLAQVGGLWTD